MLQSWKMTIRIANDSKDHCVVGLGEDTSWYPSHNGWMQGNRTARTQHDPILPVWHGTAGGSLCSYWIRLITPKKLLVFLGHHLGVPKRILIVITWPRYSLTMFLSDPMFGYLYPPVYTVRQQNVCPALMSIIYYHTPGNYILYFALSKWVYNSINWPLSESRLEEYNEGRGGYSLAFVRLKKTYIFQFFY